ncbi:TPA: flavin reductase family protein [Candidatus Woesearchaeota archaeon]|nr:flavin reductase family protein [Candidatus Woesearchaeota archaeon]
MKGLLTSRTELEIFGKIYEKEDIIPVEFDKEENNVKFKLKQNEFMHKLISKSQNFAINIPRLDFEKEADICEMNEGEFTDKFSLVDLEKLECDAIDCSCLGRSTVYECTLIKEDKDGFIGRIIKEREI